MDGHAELDAEAARLARAEAILGRAFDDRRLLLRALTHRSYLNERSSALPHNEVLELLGDAVLSLVVMEALVAASPDADEGALTERRAAHVSTENLAAAARRTGLVSLLRTGKSLAGNIPETVAADVVEAVLGACYADAGLNAARALVLHLLGPPPATTTAAVRNAKKQLQERVQRLVGKTPEYVVVRTDGPSHAPLFSARVVVAGHTLGEGRGRNKRLATEAAAAAAVDALAHLDDPGVRERLRAPP